MVQLEHRRTSGTFPETLTSAQHGDEAAWASIYRDLAGPITGYLSSRGVAEPEDLTAEVFLQVARDIHRFDGDEVSFRSWVFVIAHRRMLDWRRAIGRRPVLVEQRSEDTPGGDVEEEAIENIALTGVREVLETLTEDQRDVLTLRVIGDLSLEQTAAVTGKTVGAVKALQRRALLTVKVEMEEGRVSL